MTEPVTIVILWRRPGRAPPQPGRLALCEACEDPTHQPAQ
jgi:hypothetical protein